MKLYMECQNRDCPEHWHPKYFDKTDVYCTSCGKKLVHICEGKGCYTKIDDDNRNLCEYCKEKKINPAKVAAGIAGGVGMFALGTVAKIIKKI